MSALARIRWEETCWIFLCAALLAWQLFLPGFVGIADNGDFGKAAGPFCLGTNAAAADRLFFQPEYLRGPQFCYDPHLPMSGKLFIGLASSIEQRVGDRGRFDIRWLGALHGFVFLGFYCAVLRLLRTFPFILRVGLSLVALWIFADIGLTSYFNSFYSDTAALLGVLLTMVLGVALLAGNGSRLSLLLFALAALLFTTSKAQHAPFGVLPVALLVLSGQRTTDWRTRAMAYSSAAILLLGMFVIMKATPDWYHGQSRFNVIFRKLIRQSATRARDLRELGLETADAQYAGMIAFQTGSPLDNAAWRERFLANTSYPKILRFYAHHPVRTAAILNADLRDEAWQRRPFSLSNYRKEAGFAVGGLAGRFSSWGYLRLRLFRRWPSHILIWYALLVPGALLFAWRERNPLRRSIAWAILGFAAAAAGEFAIASLGDAFETSRHLLLFHVLTDCTFFLVLVFAASRFSTQAARIEGSRPALIAVLAVFVVAGMAMACADGFHPRTISAHTVSDGWTDDARPEVVYAGHWESGLFRDAFGGTLSYSDISGATACWQFEGARLRYVYTRAFNRGLALVSIDGVERGIVDLYSPAIEWQVSTVFEVGPGHHTAEIRVLGRRNPMSSGSYIDVDAMASR